MLAAVCQVWVLLTSKTLPAFCKTRENLGGLQGAWVGGGQEVDRGREKSETSAAPSSSSEQALSLVSNHGWGPGFFLLPPLSISPSSLLSPIVRLSAPVVWDKTASCWQTLTPGHTLCSGHGPKHFKLPSTGFPGGASGKEPACQCSRRKRHGFDPWSVRSPGEGNGNLLQYSCLENLMDKGAWWAIQSIGSQRVRHD